MPKHLPSLGVKRSRGPCNPMVISEEPKIDFPPVFLDRDQIEILGITADDLGKQFTFVAEVKVDSFSVTERAGEKGSRSASLSILEGTLERSSTNEERAEKLFGSSE